MAAKALIVDDDPVLREIALEMLAGAGYDCRTAADGEEGLAAMASEPADLLLLDMLMPNKDGIETLMEVQRRWPATRTIVITGGAAVMDQASLLRMAHNLGADGVLGKPLRAATLLPMAARLLGETSTT
ncbi:MAG TPA: response regulator [Caulobacter sp.]|nr:response regulator [Caulobacter sp.]